MSTIRQTLTNLTIYNTVDSVGTGSGTLILSGGAGISKNIYVGGTSVLGPASMTQLSNTGTSSFTGNATFGIASVLTINNTNQATSTGSGAVVILGGMGLARGITMGEDLIVGGTSSFAKNVTFDIPSVITVNNTNQATSTASGAIVMVGGIGIGKSAFVGGDLNVAGTSTLGPASVTQLSNTGTSSFTGVVTVTNATQSVSTGSGAIITSGGAGITKNVYVGGDLNITGTSTFNNSISAAAGSVITSANVNNATSTSSGALILAGGASIQKNLYVGGDLNIAGTTTLGPVSLTNLSVSGTSIFTGGIAVSSTATYDSTSVVKLQNVNNATSLSSGALTVAGGASINKNLFVGADVSITGSASASFISLTNLSVSGTSSLGGLTVSSTATFTSPSVLKVQNVNNATSLSSGALTVAGGVSINKNLFVGADVSITGSTSAAYASLTNLAVSGTSTFTSGIAVSSTATYDSTSVVKLQNVNNATSLSSGALTVAGGVSVNKNLFVGADVSITGSASAAYASLTNLLVSGTSSLGGLDVSSTATFAVGSLVTMNNTNQATSTASGALRVIGGVGIAKNLYVGGDINVTGSASFTGNAAFADGSIITVNNTNQATSTASGAVRVIGGVGIAKNLFVGGDLNVAGTSTLGPASVTQFSNSGTSSFTGAITVAGNASFADGSVITSTNTNQSTSTGSGAVVLTGGIGVGKNAYIGGDLNVTGSSILGSVSVTQFINTGTSSFTGGITVGGVTTFGTGATVTLNNTNQATSTSSGALILVGGAAIQKNLYVGGTTVTNGNINILATTNSSSTTSGALTVAGGLGVDRRINNAGAKGDLLAGNATNMSALTIGSDNQILTADSTQTLGMRWATPATAAFVATTVTISSTVTQAITSNTIGAYFIKISSTTAGRPQAIFAISKNAATTTTFDSFATFVASTGTSTGTFFNYTWGASAALRIAASDNNANGTYDVYFF